MANIIANHLFPYGPRECVDHFFAAFLRGGFCAHVPIPSDAEPSADPATLHRDRLGQIHVDHWGTYGTYPDVYWKHGDAYGVVFHSVECAPFLSTCDKTQLEAVQSLTFKKPISGVGGSTIWIPRPGYVPPSDDAAIAYFKFYSPWKPPSRWFGKVATDLYNTGLRLLMHSIDLGTFGGDGSYESLEFWSVEGPGEFHQDGNWAASVETVDGYEDNDDTEFLWHKDESAERARQSEGEK